MRAERDFNENQSFNKKTSKKNIKNKKVTKLDHIKHKKSDDTKNGNINRKKHFKLSSIAEDSEKITKLNSQIRNSTNKKKFNDSNRNDTSETIAKFSKDRKKLSKFSDDNSSNSYNNTEISQNKNSKDDNEFISDHEDIKSVEFDIDEFNLHNNKDSDNEIESSESNHELLSDSEGTSINKIDIDNSNENYEKTKVEIDDIKALQQYSDSTSDEENANEVKTNKLNNELNKSTSEKDVNLDKVKSFDEMNLHPDLKRIIKKRGWIEPTPIQKNAIPAILEGKDVIGLAVTGSGKTGAFVIPILNKMLTHKSHPFYALVLTPTRELCVQIVDQFKLLGSIIQLKVCAIVGGLSHTDQAKELAKEPHVIVASPGRLVDHLQNTKGFDLDDLEFLILDEADRLLSMDFEQALHEIIKCCNFKRQTLMFSATMTSKVSKLQKASLKNPFKVEVNDKIQTAVNLKQYIILVPIDKKFEYLVTFLKPKNAYRTIIFCNTCKIASVLSLFMKKLSFDATVLSGDLDQKARLNAINKFKNQQCNILVTTEVAARGMDLPQVHNVINFDVPSNYKDYIHRVGRTARAGSHGSSYTFVTKLDVVQYKIIENKIFGNESHLWPKVFEISTEDYEIMSKSMNFAQLKKEAEKDHSEHKVNKRIKKK